MALSMTSSYSARPSIEDGIAISKTPDRGGANESRADDIGEAAGCGLLKAFQRRSHDGGNPYEAVWYPPAIRDLQGKR